MWSFSIVYTNGNRNNFSHYFNRIIIILQRKLLFEDIVYTFGHCICIWVIGFCHGCCNSIFGTVYSDKCHSSIVYFCQNDGLAEDEDTFYWNWPSLRLLQNNLSPNLKLGHIPLSVLLEELSSPKCPIDQIRRTHSNFA